MLRTNETLHRNDAGILKAEDKRKFEKVIAEQGEPRRRFRSIYGSSSCDNHGNLFWKVSKGYSSELP